MISTRIPALTREHGPIDLVCGSNQEVANHFEVGAQDREDREGLKFNSTYMGCIYLSQCVSYCIFFTTDQQTLV